jgi:hypothetical protein
VDGTALVGAAEGQAAPVAAAAMHPSSGADTPPSVLPIIKVEAVLGHVKLVDDLQESKTPAESRIQ